MPTGRDLPSPAMLMRIAADNGLDLTAADADSYRALMAGAIESYRRLEAFSEPKPPVKYPRDGGWRRRSEDNPFNGWYWRCNIAGATSGVLAGQRVAVKGRGVLRRHPNDDRIEPARRLRARLRCDHRHPHSRCGRNDRRHHQLRGVCVLRRRAHLQPRTGPQPARPAHNPGGSSSGSAVVLATGHADMAIGGDQGGSIRLPAWRCLTRINEDPQNVAPDSFHRLSRGILRLLPVDADGNR
jgi:amidase